MLFHALRYVSFSIGNDTYTFPVQGEVDVINLDSGLTYLTGPLYGEVTINDVYYQVSAGFNKVMERDGVSFCMLMTPVNVGQRQTLVFSFGHNKPNPFFADSTVSNELYPICMLK